MFAVVYASTTGNTHCVAELIARRLGAPLFDLASLTQSLVDAHNPLVFCTSTWGQGDLQDDWLGQLGRLSRIDFSKTVYALCVLGDQKNYSDCFASAGKKLFDFFGETGARLIGLTNKDNYSFEKSGSFIDGKFLGLIIDEDNQHHLSDGRIASWCAKIKIEYDRISKTTGANP